MATLLIYGVLMIVMTFVIHDAWTFGVAFFIHTVFSGCYWTVSSPLGQSLFPRISFAQYSSAAGIVSSLFTIAFGPILGRLLDVTNHDYRLTFLLGGIFGVVAFVVLLKIYGEFKRLGGTSGYVAPE